MGSSKRSAVNLLTLLIFTGIAISFLLSSCATKKPYSGEFINSRGETIHAEIRLMDDFLMKKEIVLTDGDNVTVSYSVRGEDDTYLPQDMISRTTDDGYIVWVKESNGTEFIEVSERNAIGTRLYVDTEKSIIDSYTVNAVDTAESCGFIKNLPETCDKQAWEQYFERVHERNKTDSIKKDNKTE